MKLKYYLRGLGIGIIVTAVILMIASRGNQESLTDEEIIARARQLGMVMQEEAAEEEAQQEAEEAKKETEGSTENLSEADVKEEAAEDLSKNQTKKPEESKSEEADKTETDKSKDADKKDSDKKDSDKKSDTSDKKETDKKSDTSDKKENDKKETETKKDTSDKKNTAEPVLVDVEVNGGEYSDRISEKLQAAGLITDAADFNKYLMDNKYDSNLAVGLHRIPQGADYEEIARILCEKPE